MSIYTLQKKLFSKNLVDNYGRKLELKNTAFKLKEAEGGFVLSASFVKTPVLKSVEVESGNRCICETADGKKIILDLETAKMSVPFTHSSYDRYGSRILVGENNALTLLDAGLNCKDLGYFGVLETNSFNKLALKQASTYNYCWLTYAKDKNGKYGILNQNGNVIVPFEFEIPDITLEKTIISNVTHRTELFIFKCGDRQIVVNTSGQVLRDGNKTECTELYNDEKTGYSFYDAKTDTSAIYEFNHETLAFDQVTTLDGNAKYLNAKTSNGSRLYATKKDGKFAVVDANGNTIIPREFDYIKKVDVKGNSSKRDILFATQIGTGKKDAWGNEIMKSGVYSYNNQKQLLPAKYEIAFDLSYWGKNDNYRFLASDGEYWGVVDDKGEVIVDFEYKLPTTKFHVSDGRNSYLKLKDKNDNEVYIKDGSLTLATAEDIKNIEEHGRHLQASAEQDKQRKLAQQQREEAERTRAAQAAAKEEKATNAAIVAGILTESPIVGMMVYDHIMENEDLQK